MGRMKRHRKLKACDPFNKSNLQGYPKVDDIYDKPLTKEQINDDYHFNESTSFKRFQSAIEFGASIKGKRKVRIEKVNAEKRKVINGKEKIKKIVRESQQLPGESKRDMFRRLDHNIHQAMNEAMRETKTIRQKRKEHLQARDEKKKKKKTKEIESQQQTGQIKDFESFKDNVKFGEIVDAPPELTAAPRKAPKKEKTLQLHALFEKNHQNDNKNIVSDKPKRRRDMNDGEKEEFDEERQRAIDAYRLVKKRREIRKT